jgi:hypothetical protein
VLVVAPSCWHQQPRSFCPSRAMNWFKRVGEFYAVFISSENNVHKIGVWDTAKKSTTTADDFHAVHVGCLASYCTALTVTVSIQVKPSFFRKKRADQRVNTYKLTYLLHGVQFILRS